MKKFFLALFVYLTLLATVLWLLDTDFVGPLLFVIILVVYAILPYLKQFWPPRFTTRITRFERRGRHSKFKRIRPPMEIRCVDNVGQWGPFALRYLRYRLDVLDVDPNSEGSRSIAWETQQMIGIPQPELCRFINSLLNGNIGRSFKRERAEEIAILWCVANKKLWRNNITVEDEFFLIRNGARLMKADPREALAFNLYLAKYC